MSRVYLGEQQIKALLSKASTEGLGPVLFAVDSNVVYRSSIGTSYINATITLPSAPKWYKCFGADNVASRTSSAPMARNSNLVLNVKPLIDDLSEATPTITNNSKTFTLTKAIVSSPTYRYIVGIQLIVLVYVL